MTADDEWTPLRLVAMQAENHHAAARSNPDQAMSHARFLADYLRGVGQRIDTPTLVGMIVATPADDDLGGEAVTCSALAIRSSLTSLTVTFEDAAQWSALADGLSFA